MLKHEDSDDKNLNWKHSEVIYLYLYIYIYIYIYIFEYLNSKVDSDGDAQT